MLSLPGVVLSRAVPVPNGELRVDCPFCGDTGRHMYVNAERGLYHCFRCGASGRLSEASPSLAAVRTSVSTEEPVPLARVAAAYEALLNVLNLSHAHKEHLMSPKRGMSGAEIAERGYRTLPDIGRTAIASRVSSAASVEGVPGFYKHSSGMWCLAGPSGILIPVRAFDGRIWGMQVRRDKSAGGSRYVWLSSAGKEGGTPARARYHVAYPKVSERRLTNRVWLTEGPLKADIAASRLGDVVVAVPGVNCWKSTGVIKALRQAGVRDVVLAFDSDARTNRNVGKALDEVLSVLVKSFDVRVAVWDQEYKGIDDALLARKVLKLLSPGQYRRQFA
jgi:hypothetical protein